MKSASDRICLGNKTTWIQSKNNNNNNMAAVSGGDVSRTVMRILEHNATRQAALLSAGAGLVL